MQYLQSDPWAQKGTVDNGPGAALAGIGNVFGDPLQNALQQQKQALTAREIAGQGQLGSLFAHPGVIDNATAAAAAANGIDPQKIGEVFRLTNALNGGVDSDLSARAATGIGAYNNTPLFQQRAEAAAASQAQNQAILSAQLDPKEVAGANGMPLPANRLQLASGNLPSGTHLMPTAEGVKGALAGNVLTSAPLTDDQNQYLGLTKPDAAPKFQVTGEDAFGNKVYGYPSPPPDAGAAPAAASPVATPAEASQALNLHGADFLKTLDPQTAGQVQSIIDGRTPYPTGMLLKTPYGQKLAAFVTQADPSFEAGNATARVKARQDFETGGPNSVAGTILAGNTALAHLGSLSDQVAGLGNTNAPFGSTLLNGVQNAVKGTGSAGAPLATFNAINGRLAEEMTKFYRGTGGTESDVARDMANISPNMSPTQLHAGLAAMAKLTAGKLDALQARWHNAMGPMVPDFPISTPEAQHSMDTVMSRAGGSTGGLASPPAIPTLPGVTPPREAGAFAPPPPKVGDVVKGHAYLGGDPSDKASWRSVPGAK